MTRRTTAGRKKLVLAKIKKEDALQVTFSKRRSGVFKKAAEMSILCGSNLGIFLFSPGGRAYSFGSPDVQTIMQRFITNAPLPPPNPLLDRGILVKALARDFMQVTEAHDQATKQRSELIKASRMANYKDDSQLNAHDLNNRISAIEQLKHSLLTLKLHMEQLASNDDHVGNNLPPSQTNLATPMDGTLFDIMQPMGGGVAAGTVGRGGAGKAAGIAEATGATRGAAGIGEASQQLIPMYTMDDLIHQPQDYSSAINMPMPPQHMNAIDPFGCQIQNLPIGHCEPQIGTQMGQTNEVMCDNAMGFNCLQPPGDIGESSYLCNTLPMDPFEGFHPFSGLEFPSNAGTSDVPPMPELHLNPAEFFQP